MDYKLEYYNSSVQAALNAWPVGIRTNFRGITIRMIEHGPYLGFPHTRAMSDGLFEIRAKGAEGIGRAFFCMLVERRIVILHSFIKKTDKTPQRELNIARARLQEVKNATRQNHI